MFRRGNRRSFEKSESSSPFFSRNKAGLFRVQGEALVAAKDVNASDVELAFAAALGQ